MRARLVQIGNSRGVRLAKPLLKEAGLTDAPVKRGDVFRVELNPTRGRKIRNTRPCVVVSPDELNAHMGT